MKIDLHIHTKSDNKGNTGREISSSKFFVDTLVKANVGIAAITNHNILDVDQFEEIIEEAKDKKILILPGVEIDVSIVDIDGNNVRRQMNIIYPLDMYENLNAKLISYQISSKNPLPFSEVIEAFAIENSIFYLDSKNHKNSWSDFEIEKYFNFDYKFALLRDVNNSNTHFLLASKQQSSLVGSDLMNWDNYEIDYSNKLIDYNIENLDFITLLNILKGNINLEVFTKSINQKTISKLNIGNKFTINNLPITSGVNVIFGPKSTGKTELLKGLHSSNSDSKIIYFSENRGDTFNNLQSKIEFSEIAKTFEKEFTTDLNFIIGYKEENFLDFNKFYFSIRYDKENLFKINKVKTDNLVKISNSNEEVFIKHANQTLKNMESVREESDRIELNNLFKKISYDFKLHYLTDNNLYFLNSMLKTLKTGINEILLSNKGIYTAPDNIGLFDLYKERKQFWNTFEKIKNYEDQITINYEIEIPSGNTYQKISVIKFPNFDATKNTDYLFSGETHKKNSKQYFKESIVTLNSKTYLSNPRNEITALNNLLTIYTELVCKKSYFALKDTTNERDLSNGEKAFVVLSDFLKTEKNNIYLDEPGTFLGSEMIKDFLIPKIIELNLLGKNIFITTHMSELGINTMPYNLIYRSNNMINDIYQTYVGNFGTEVFVNLENDSDRISFEETLLNNFEGGKINYEFRKGIYKSRNEKY